MDQATFPLPAGAHPTESQPTPKNTPAHLALAHAQTIRDQLLHLPGLLSPVIHGPQLAELFDELLARTGILRQVLASASLPLSADIRHLATTLMQAYRQLAECHLRLIDRQSDSRDAVATSQKTIQCLTEEFLSACLIAAAPAPGLWQLANQAIIPSLMHTQSLASTGEILGEHQAVLQQYALLAALASSQPEALAPQDLLLIEDYLLRFGNQTSLSIFQPEQHANMTHWVDISRDQGPCAVQRRPAPQQGTAIRIDFAPLAIRVHQHLHALAHGTPPSTIHLPEEAARESFRILLKRVAATWTAPARRRHARRQVSYRVQLLTGLRPITRLLSSTSTPRLERLSEWMVVNESPTGFAIMHISGTMGAMRPGGVVILRAGLDRPWTVCVIRWLRSENPEHIELGLETLGINPEPVQIAFMGNLQRQTAQPAILLPAIGQIRARPAILVGRGSTLSRRFVMVQENGTKLIVSQGSLDELDLQTAGVEMFRFEIDPSVD